MSLTLEFTDTEERALHQEAERLGMLPEQLVHSWVRKELKATRATKFSELLREWVEEGDEEEQRETFEALSRGIDENRKGYRTLFS